MSIEAHIEQHLGLSIINKQSVSTGLFSAYQVTLSDGNTVFVKYQSNPNQQLINEGRELALLGKTIHTPAVLGSCKHCLILEWIDITHNSNMQSKMGLALAELHQNTSDYFGFGFDNKIGKTPQLNGVDQNIDNWAYFYWQYRLLYQITLAYRNTLIGQ
ncbi:MAG: fructosamine kinase, partial [Candidatus Thioglobus sp.]